MAKSTSQKIKVGVFVVLGTVILTFALYAIGKRQHLFTKNIPVYAVFTDVKGLQPGNNIRYSGINVGTVSKIEMLRENKIAVQMSVEEKTAGFIGKTAVASITSDGLVGSMVINILPGKDSHSERVKPGDTILSYSKTSTDEMLSTLSTTNDNIALISSNLLKVSEQIVQGKGTLGALINDTLILKDLKQVITDLQQSSQAGSTAIQRINTIISKVDYEQSAAAVLLSDTLAAHQTRSLFENLEKSGQDIQEITQSFQDYLDSLKSGQGALHHLTQDENLVQDIDTTVTNIKEASEKLNQNMEALKHNFLFRSYFRKLERQKKKAN